MTQFAKYLAAGLAVAALGNVALAIGIIFAALLFGTARAPWLSGVLTGQAFLGFALCEAMALLILLLAILILFI